MKHPKLLSVTPCGNRPDGMVKLTAPDPPNHDMQLPTEDGAIQALPFLGERRGAKAGLDPVRYAITPDAGLLQVVKILVARNRALTERALSQGLSQCSFATGFQTSFNQIAHTVASNLQQNSRCQNRFTCLLQD